MVKIMPSQTFLVCDPTSKNNFLATPLMDSVESRH